MGFYQKTNSKRELVNYNVHFSNYVVSSKGVKSSMLKEVLRSNSGGFNLKNSVMHILVFLIKVEYSDSLISSSFGKRTEYYWSFKE